MVKRCSLLWGKNKRNCYGLGFFTRLLKRVKISLLSKTSFLRFCGLLLLQTYLYLYAGHYKKEYKVFKEREINGIVNSGHKNVTKVF